MHAQALLHTHSHKKHKNAVRWTHTHAHTSPMSHVLCPLTIKSDVSSWSLSSCNTVFSLIFEGGLHSGTNKGKYYSFLYFKYHCSCLFIWNASFHDCLHVKPLSHPQKSIKHIENTFRQFVLFYCFSAFKGFKWSLLNLQSPKLTLLLFLYISLLASLISCPFLQSLSISLPRST